jgi:hypothetical protein
VQIKKIKLKITLKKIGIAKYSPKAYASLYISKAPSPTTKIGITGTLKLKISGSSSKLKIGFIRSIAKMLKISYKLVTVTQIIKTNVVFSIAASSQTLAETMKVRMVSKKYIKVFTNYIKKSYKIRITSFKATGLIVTGALEGGGAALVQGSFSIGGSGWKSSKTKKYKSSFIRAFIKMLKIKSSAVSILSMKVKGGVFSLGWSIACKSLDLAEEWKLKVVQQQFMLIFVEYLVQKLEFSISSFQAVDVQALPAKTTTSSRRRRRRKGGGAPKGGRRLADNDEAEQDTITGADLQDDDDDHDDGDVEDGGAEAESDALDDLPLSNSLQLDEELAARRNEKLDLKPADDDDDDVISDEDLAALPEDSGETFALSSSSSDFDEDGAAEPTAA